MEKIFGNYAEEVVADEYLALGFSPTSTPLKLRWRNNGLSADFIADYMETFFVGSDETEVPTITKQIKNAVKYIANELLENTMKFHDENSPFSIKIAFHLRAPHVIFYAVNSLSAEHVDSFQDFVQGFVDSDPHELYFERMEANASEDGGNHSGLGLLSMVCDYGASLAWKFEQIESVKTEQPVWTVATMVSLKI